MCVRWCSWFIASVHRGRMGLPHSGAMDADGVGGSCPLAQGYQPLPCLTKGVASKCGGSSRGRSVAAAKSISAQCPLTVAVVICITLAACRICLPHRCAAVPSEGAPWLTCGWGAVFVTMGNRGVSGVCHTRVSTLGTALAVDSRSLPWSLETLSLEPSTVHHHGLCFPHTILSFQLYGKGDID